MTNSNEPQELSPQPESAPQGMSKNTRHLLGLDEEEHSGATSSDDGRTSTPEVAAGLGAEAAGGERVAIKDVWASNLEETMEEINQLVERYPVVAFDTEFPGVVLEARSSSAWVNPTDLAYANLSKNVNVLSVIQLGMAFFDRDGRRPTDGTGTYQFNFEFDLQRDPHAQDAINLLSRAGLDFARHKKDGIQIEHFGEAVISSGLVMNDEVTWIAFHGQFDFAYLLKVLTNCCLPADPREFFDLLHLYFPVYVDIKYAVRDEFKGGLSSLARSLHVRRHGATHQGGSDALLTGTVYFALEPHCRDATCSNILYGLDLRECSGGYYTTQAFQPGMDQFQPNMDWGMMQGAEMYAYDGALPAGYAHYDESYLLDPAGLITAP